MVTVCNWSPEAAEPRSGRVTEFAAPVVRGTRVLSQILFVQLSGVTLKPEKIVRSVSIWWRRGYVGVPAGHERAWTRWTPPRSVAGRRSLDFLVDFLQAAAYLTGAAVPGSVPRKEGGQRRRPLRLYSFVIRISRNFPPSTLLRMNNPALRKRWWSWQERMLDPGDLEELDCSTLSVS
jgi:hypothetical protein